VGLTRGIAASNSRDPYHQIPSDGHDQWLVTRESGDWLGARIDLKGDTALVHGVNGLRGAPVMATDLRASVSLIIAGLAAQGETTIGRVYHLDHGFDRIEEKLSKCGAQIERLSA